MVDLIYIYYRTLLSPKSPQDFFRSPAGRRRCTRRHGLQRSGRARGSRRTRGHDADGRFPARIEDFPVVDRNRVASLGVSERPDLLRAASASSSGGGGLSGLPDVEFRPGRVPEVRRDAEKPGQRRRADRGGRRRNFRSRNLEADPGLFGRRRQVCASPDLRRQVRRPPARLPRRRRRGRRRARPRGGALRFFRRSTRLGIWTRSSSGSG